MVDLLRPLSRGKFLESDTLLWQSYWWLCPSYCCCRSMVAQKTRGVNMSAALEPITRQRLEQFRRRWLTLETAKGLAVAWLLGLAFLLVVIIVDASLLYPNAVRWLLSGTSIWQYSAVSTAPGGVWGLVSNCRPRRKHFEELDPSLRERLLSAVELSEDTEANCFSSAVFVRAFKPRFASMIAPVRVTELLPWSSIARGLMAAACGVVVMIGLTGSGPSLAASSSSRPAPWSELGTHLALRCTDHSPNRLRRKLPDGSVVAIEASVAGPLPIAFSWKPGPRVMPTPWPCAA